VAGQELLWHLENRYTPVRCWLLSRSLSSCYHQSLDIPYSSDAESPAVCPNEARSTYPSCAWVAKLHVMVRQVDDEVDASLRIRTSSMCICLAPSSILDFLQSPQDPGPVPLSMLFLGAGLITPLGIGTVPRQTDEPRHISACSLASAAEWDTVLARPMNPVLWAAMITPLGIGTVFRQTDKPRHISACPLSSAVGSGNVNDQPRNSILSQPAPWRVLRDQVMWTTVAGRSKSYWGLSALILAQSSVSIFGKSRKPRWPFQTVSRYNVDDTRDGTYRCRPPSRQPLSSNTGSSPTGRMALVVLTRMLEKFEVPWWSAAERRRPHKRTMSRSVYIKKGKRRKGRRKKKEVYICIEHMKDCKNDEE